MGRCYAPWIFFWVRSCIQRLCMSILLKSTNYYLLPTTYFLLLTLLPFTPPPSVSPSLRPFAPPSHLSSLIAHRSRLHPLPPSPIHPLPSSSLHPISPSHLSSLRLPFTQSPPSPNPSVTPSCHLFVSHTHHSSPTTRHSPLTTHHLHYLDLGFFRFSLRALCAPSIKLCVISMDEGIFLSHALIS